MSNVVPFPVRVPACQIADFDPEIDLFTAVDVAIRDLRDLALRLRDDAAGAEQASECMAMLERALEAARLPLEA